MGKKSGSGSGMNNPDHISECLETIFFWVKILKFFDADPGSGIEKFGSWINIPDSQHCYSIIVVWAGLNLMFSQLEKRIRVLNYSPAPYLAIGVFFYHFISWEKV
jgi:hypothetical protein